MSETSKNGFIGLTGCIASGKSTAAAILERLGARIIDADVLARDCTKPGTSTLKAITESFGNAYIQKDGTLNRRLLRELIFSNLEAKKALEAIVHPCVRLKFYHELELLKDSKAQAPIIGVIPLLFESANDYPTDRVILIAAKRETCIQRLMNRDRCEREVAENMLNSQLPIDKKKALATYVIDNDGSLDELKEKVSNLFSLLGYPAKHKL